LFKALTSNMPNDLLMGAGEGFLRFGSIFTAQTYNKFNIVELLH